MAVIVCEALPTMRIADVAAVPTEARWLIRGIWSREGVGVIGGQPKNCKSHFGIDVATSVASNTPCLDRFPVEDPGPALIYLAEDALPLVRERVAGVAAHRGLDLAHLDVHTITVPTLRLDVESDQARLRATIERLRPKILVLDPLVRLHACDENSSQEMAGLLGYLRDIQRAHHVAVVLVHHLGKKSHGQLGQGLRGSGDLYAWGDDYAYLTRKDDALLLTLEHRSAPATDPIALRLVADDDGSQVHLQADDLRRDDPVSVPEVRVPLPERILDVLARARRSAPRTALRAELRVNNKRLGDALADLEQRGLIARSNDGWRLRGVVP